MRIRKAAALLCVLFLALPAAAFGQANFEAEATSGFLTGEDYWGVPIAVRAIYTFKPLPPAVHPDQRFIKTRPNWVGGRAMYTENDDKRALLVGGEGGGFLGDGFVVKGGAGIGFQQPDGDDAEFKFKMDAGVGYLPPSTPGLLIELGLTLGVNDAPTFTENTPVGHGIAALTTQAASWYFAPPGPDWALGFGGEVQYTKGDMEFRFLAAVTPNDQKTYGEVSPAMAFYVRDDLKVRMMYDVTFTSDVALHYASAGIEYYHSQDFWIGLDGLLHVRDDKVSAGFLVTLRPSTKL